MKKTKISTKLFLLLAVSFVAFCSCKKDNGNSNNKTTTAFSYLDGIWATPAWGGTPNDTLRLQIASTTDASGQVLSIGNTTWNYSVGETILFKVSPVVSGNVTSNRAFTGSGIYKHGSGNAVVDTSDVTISLTNNYTQMQVGYAATGLSYYYVKQ